MLREIRSAVGERENRFLKATTAVTVRAKGGAELPTIEGHGALFNDETVIGSWFRERILPGAFKDSLKSDDIRVAFNHDPNQILGRTSAKTATVEEDDKGLVYKAEPPDTTFGRDVVVSIKRGDITGSSFQFAVEQSDDEEWDYSETKKGMLPLRTIKKARLYETGPVAFPAYENTTVSARAMGKVEEARALAEAARTATPPAETPAPPVVESQRTAADLRRDIQRDLDLLSALATERQAPPEETPAPVVEPVTPPAPVAAVEAPAARAAVTPAPPGEFSIDRELESLLRELV